MPTVEVNFDGIVGPTHNYAGLSPGNVASDRNRGETSSPKKAAIQGLEKARRLADLGLVQHVLPPHERPDIPSLRVLGFEGSDKQVLATAAREAPDALAAACSASAMWAANAATVSPSPDASDARLHLTPANLAFNRHRSVEPAFATAVLRRIFADETRFAVHDPLPATPRLFDEGAANHTRLARRHADPGVELFCFGRPAGAGSDLDCGVTTHPARQSEEASRALARRHRLDPARTVFARQSPGAIDAGVFHNDVISVGNEDVLLVHERAYDDTPGVIENLRAAMGGPLHVFLVTEGELPLAEAVDTYFFNSQLVTLPGAAGEGRMLLIAPGECEQSPRARECADRLLAECPAVGGVRFVDVRESMRNGGGPACLRLRVVMADAEQAALAARTRLDDALHAELTAWVERHYRDEIRPADLADPALLTETRAALDELSRILDLGPIYPFQR
ncbi:MAG: N-succinylarginine dihydrolase [Phycisphaeraceae bacterium]|nr:MAG: N-succinylarginine dihydrolase [Phycisphaeraceae bacterium]